MKKHSRLQRLLACCTALLCAASLAGCSAASSDVPVIGISQYGEHASLDNCREGFLQGLADAGLTEGKDYEVSYQNAGFEDNTAIQIAQNFAAQNVALMCAVATPSATACYAAAEDKDIPVVYTAISDPQAAGVVGGNITGTSDKLPVAEQLRLIRALQPEADTIGILYTTSEPNSVSAVAEYEKQAPAYGFTIDALGVTAQSEVTQAADTLLQHEVDCFSNLTDNNVVGVLPSILEKTNEAGVPVYGSEIEQVLLGCAASAGIDYFELGRQTGAMAVRVLEGERAGDIPYETVSGCKNYVSTAVMDAMGLQIPEGLEVVPVESNTESEAAPAPAERKTSGMLDLVVSTLTQGLIYALLSYGIYITYKILDFPDLTVDGSFPLGAAVTAVLLIRGLNPFLTLLVAMGVGALAGLATGVIHVRLGVRDLLAGIITMTALFSINLQIAGSNLYVERGTDTIFTAPFTMTLFGGMSLLGRKLVVSLLLALLVKLVIDLYFRTKNGLLLRAVGNNSTLVTTLARDKGAMKIQGLILANALVALCGSVVCQEQRAFSSTMGTGQMVFGLATVIIGTTLFKKLSFVKGTTAVLAGSVVYKTCIQIAISLGLPANLLKLVTAALFLVILVLGERKAKSHKKGGVTHA